MADGPTYDDFLADPVGVWQADGDAVPEDWAIQAARASRAFRVHLKDALCRAVAQTGGFDPVEREAFILAEICDASDVAALFSELAAVRPPTDWAPTFAKRFAKPSVPPSSTRSR